MYTDPIADFLTRLRNAFRARKTQVLVPYSNVKFEMSKILEKNKYILNVEILKDGNKSFLMINLPEKGIDEIKPSFDRVSTPGRRIYLGSKEIRPVNNGYGLSIISTSKGIMTGYEAYYAGLGGEILCNVY